MVDEDFTYNGIATGLSCDGVGECGIGTVYCVDTSTSDCSTNPGGPDDESQPETCNTLDDDCDSEVDEGGVCEILSITLSNAPVVFSNMNPGATTNANIGNEFPLTVTIDSETTVTDVSVSVKANVSDFVCDGGGCNIGTDKFAVSNMEWSPSSTFPGTDYTTSDATVCTGLVADDTCNIYHQLYVPAGQTAGSYGVGITIIASGSPP